MATAEQLENNGQYELAYKEYQRMYSANPKNSHILEKLGHIALILDKKEDAENYYSRITELDPNNIVAYQQLMDLCCDTNKYRYYIAKGQMHLLEQQKEHAISDYKKAVERANDEVEANNARFVLANLYEQENKPNQAIDEYLKLMDVDYENPLVYINLANIYRKTDFLESAIDTLEKARKKGYEEVNDELAKLYILADDSQKAMEITKDELLKIRCLMDMGKNDEAFSIMKEVEDKYKKSSKYLALKAQYYYQIEDFDNAFDSVEAYSKFEPNSPLIYQMRAMIYEKKGDEVQEHINWAKFNSLKGDKDVAMNEYMIAYQIDDSNIDLVTTIADTLDQTDKNHSVEFYEGLLELNPKSKRALQKLAEFRERIGDYREMLSYMDRLKEVDPRNPYVKQNYDKIQDKIVNGSSFLDTIKNLFKGTMG